MTNASLSSPVVVSPRKFGLAVGSAFVLIAVLFSAPGRGRVVLGAFGAVLFVAALLAPRVLTPLSRAWMTLGHALGLITTPIIFTLLWLVAFMPVGWLRRTFSASPLSRDPHAATYWVERPAKSADAARAALRRQF